jgi:hypothetical protein
MERLGSILVVSLVAVWGNGASASSSVGAYTHPDVIWRGDFERGVASLRNNCYSALDGWCVPEIVRPEQIQIVENPVAQGKYAARFEVKYGDVYTNPFTKVTYSGSRSLISGPDVTYEDEGSERWYRWQVLLPLDFVADYPKWDQLSSSNETSTIRQPSGYNLVWHHEGDGSAPLYINANSKYFSLCLVDFVKRSCTNINLAPVIRGRWVDFLLHATWSSDPNLGFLEMWMDGEHVLPRVFAANMYPGIRNYLVTGLYRDGHIGDPSLRYTSGAPVYGLDGTPTVVYLDGFVIGNSWESVMSSGTMVPWSGNLLLNGDFLLGLTNWERWDFPRISAGKGEGRIQAGAGSARFAQSVYVQPHHQYRLSFRMKTEDASGSFQVLVNDAPSGNSRLSKEINYVSSQEYVDYVYSFSSRESATVYVYVGNWGGSAGNAYIADVSLLNMGQVTERTGSLTEPGILSAVSFGLGRILAKQSAN